MAAAVMNGTVNYFVGRQKTLDTANLTGKSVSTDYFGRNENNSFPEMDIDMSNVSDKNGSVNYFASRDDSLHSFPVTSSVPEKTDQFDLHFNNQSVGSDDLNQLISTDGTVPDTQILDLHNSDLNMDQLDNGVKNKSDIKAPPRVIGLCKVCGDEASGMYFGALVCVPCKTFFLRYAGDNSFVCKRSKNCEITVYSRTHCKYCRMMKCLNVGMCRKERPDQVQITEGQQLCIVCQDLANGIHFGAITCEGCKKFFRRGLTEHQSYSCKNDKNCVINPRTRNACRFCRFQKCLRAGMSREAIQMGRPSKVRYNQDNHMHGCELEKKRPHLDSSGDSGHSSTHSSPILRVPDHFLSYSDIFSRPLLQCDVQSLTGSLSGVSAKANADIILGSFDFLQPSFALQQQPLAAVSASSSVPMYQTLANIPTVGDMKPQILQQNQLQPAVQHVIVPQQQQRVSLPASDIWALQPNKFDAKTVNYFSDLLSEESAELPRIMPVEIPLSRDGLGIGEGNRSLAVLSTLNNVTLPEIGSTSAPWSYANSGIDINLRNILKVEKEKALELCHADITNGSVITDWGVDNDDAMSPKGENGIALSEIMGEHNAEAGKDIQSSFAGSVLQVNVDSLEVPAPSEQSMAVQYRDNYWTDSTLPNEDIFLSEEHMKIVQDILAAYNRFVDTGSNINQQLRREFDNLRAQGIPEAETVEKLHARIHFLYTVSSVTYCQSLPGFRAFNRADQYRLIRLGQSQSRMLVAACHWYTPDSDSFKDFMFWRDNTYPVKQHLLEFSRDFHKLHLDRVEAALMNTLIITATDYPGLENTAAIEDHRQTVLKAFRAYTTAVYGSRNKRLEMLFGYVPRLRELGNEHHKSTFDISITSNVPASSVTQTVSSQAPINPDC